MPSDQHTLSQRIEVVARELRSIGATATRLADDADTERDLWLTDERVLGLVRDLGAILADNATWRAKRDGQLATTIEAVADVLDPDRAVPTR